ncbi:glycosyltransferase family 2 protein [Knoellia sp. 3-2P3]|uniref:glycosyltransferase n=1 Tax=unclassified Knoellia TaxID=2618719 RepID=UPI0023D9D2FF|nr:glycosyltransferase family 2 protein [Knoellia sp. 3-2P3]MDF2091116.1 glycosyltransferase family 2 protein [Knoellia sp. 3-2P3]
MTDVLVAIPARDEEHRVTRCLDSVADALRHARRSAGVQRAALAVAVHRSTDQTAALVDHALAALPDLEVYRHTDADSGTVGEVRRRLVSAAGAALGLASSPKAWVFSTDADSVVPTHWVSALLAHARAAEAHCIAGLVDLEGWRAHPAAAAAYGQIVRDGMAAVGHRHVYGANLAVRMDAYAAVGGFPAVAHGEDHDLVRSLRAGGHRVLAVREPAVLTSGRMPGRARHGLGDLLDRLVSDCSCCAG